MKKYAPPPERDPVPAMFVGEEAPPPPMVPAAWTEAAATQPDDLRVVTEGENAGKWVLFSPLLFLGGLGLVGTVPRAGAAMMGGGALYGLCGWTLHWHARKRLKLFQLSDEGITLTVRHRWGGKARVTRIVWAEMRKYTAVDADRAFLRVEDDFGGTITLDAHPARGAEFIRRFVEQAGRHGIPSEPLPPSPWTENEEKEDDPDVKKGLGCLFWFVGVGTINGLGDALGVSDGLTMVLAMGLPSLALYLWNSLHDSGIALRDSTSRKRMARLRRWLREVLGIDVV